MKNNLKLSPVITNQCNVGCKFCGFACAPIKKLWNNKITDAVIEDLSFSGLFSNTYVTLWPWGGEVFEEFDLLDETYSIFQNFFYRNGVSWKGLISTSGISFLSNTKAIDWLNLYVDCDLQYSYDRRKPWQEDVWPIIDKYYMKQVGVKATIDETNYEDLFKWVCDTYNKWGHKINACKITAPANFETPFDVSILRNEFKKFSIRELEFCFGLRKDLSCDRSASCGMGSTIVVDADGNYFPCHFGDSYNKKGILGSINDRGISVTKLRELKNVAYDKFMEQCPNCPFKSICFYCPNSSLLENGKIIPNRKYCNWASTLGEVYFEKLGKKITPNYKSIDGVS